MQSRYLGSDESLAAGQKAAASVYDTALAGTKRVSDSVNAFIDTSLQTNERLMALSQQNLEAKARANANPSGIAALANAGVQYLTNKKKIEDETALAQQKITDEKAQQALKAARAANYEKAVGSLGQLTQDYYDSGAINRDVVKEKGTITGSQSYRDAALKEITAIGDLDPEDKVKLLNRINEVADTAAQARQRKLGDAIDKQQAARADVIEAGLEQDLVGVFANIKKAGVTEQASPWLNQITTKLKEFMGADNNLTEEQKLNIAAKLIRQTTQAYGIKAENYAQYNSDLLKFQEYAKAYNQAALEYRVPGSADYNKYEAFKTKVGLAKNKYGDWSKDVAQLNESERLQKETIEIQLQQQKIKEEAAKVAGTRYPFSPSMSVWVAANAISNPFYANMVKSSAYADNPDVKNGLYLASEYQKYEEDKAKLGVELSGIGVEYARMDLRRAEAMATVINKLAKGQQEGTLSPADTQFMSELQQQSPELYGILASKMSNPTQQIDAEALNRALNLEQNAITNVQNAIIQQHQAKQVELQTKYQHLQQAGLLTERTEIGGIAERNKSQFQKELDAAQNYINDAASKAVSPQTYGIPPNFNGSSTFAPDVDESGRVRIAPRGRLQTLNVGGKQIITPIKRGANAPVTSGYGVNRGDHQHAGGDFGMEGGEKAVALVSGVAYPGTASGYGGYIDVVGDNGYVYRYAHQQALVKYGQRVSAGQEVSYSNGTGTNRGGDHLHFEVRNRPVYGSDGKYQPQWGFGGTVDPFDHLSRLSVNDSNVVKPRSNAPEFGRTHPHLKAAPNSHVTNNGVFNANYFQMPGSGARQADKVFNNQRPLTKGAVPWTKGSSPRYDYNDDYGYAPLRQNPNWRRALVEGAKQLQVPAHWLADIIQQESGWKVDLNHGGGITGIIGFADPNAGRKPFEQQIKMAVDYYRSTGWFDVLKRKGAQATIGDLWILSRAGTVPLKKLGGKNMRQYIIDGGNPHTLMLNDLKTSYGYELGLLGKWVGRKYSVPTAGRVNSNARASRNKAIATEYVPVCSICDSLERSGSWVPHQHDNLG